MNFNARLYLLYYRAMLDAQMPKHQKRVLKIIKILKINFSKESDRLNRVLFKYEEEKLLFNKKDFLKIRISK